jgi:dTMP kinase
VIIVLEGIDGTGKTTQTGLLHERLLRKGYAAERLREPTDGPWGRAIRRALLRGGGWWLRTYILGLFILDRLYNVYHCVKPQERRGRLVLLDRYWYSTYVYQGLSGWPDWLLKAMNAPCPVPDLTLLLDQAPAVSLERMRGKADHDQVYETAEFLRAARERYRCLGSRPEVRRVDSSGSVAAVHEAIWGEVSLCLRAHTAAETCRRLTKRARSWSGIPCRSRTRISRSSSGSGSSASSSVQTVAQS